MFYVSSNTYSYIIESLWALALHTFTQHQIHVLTSFKHRGNRGNTGKRVISDRILKLV